LWAETGPVAYNKLANAWWKENNTACKKGGLLDQMGVDGRGWEPTEEQT
jgi:hypothetical protein